MVGTVASHMKPQKKTFADLTAQFVGKPFRAGGQGPDGYDCLGFVYAFLREQGKADHLKIEFGRWNLDNYHDYYRCDRIAAESQTLFEVYEANGVEIHVGMQIAGDPVIVRTAAGHFFPGIYAGNGHVLASFVDAGVRTVTIDNKILFIVKVRRL